VWQDSTTSHSIAVEVRYFVLGLAVHELDYKSHREADAASKLSHEYIK
jgi:hypothetical protein